LKTALFDFHLPESLIATRPANPRESARLLVVAGALQDKTIGDLPEFLKAGDIVVFNDSRVIPARLWGKKGSASIEILLHKSVIARTPHVLRVAKQSSLDRFANARDDASQWQCFAKPAKKIKPGDKIMFAEDFSAEVVEKKPDGQVVVDFAIGNTLFSQKLEMYGQMPLPPYIEKKRGADDADKRDYQTVYAAQEGSVAAPTAGLHFTPELLKIIDALGVHRAHVTLHVGGGTFLPVKTEDTAEHIMHSEWAHISLEMANAINEAKQRGGRVIAVGTTALRTLESAADAQGRVHPFSGETAIFITPGYRFKVVDVLLTNFHLPKSTLFMLVSAFSGLERMQAAYKHAIKQRYRFYSYGDACLLQYQ
jgi:S-adenosylmethionine:tRNA ribosyltransferase-isomerase